MNEENYRIRKGKGVRWQQISSHSVIAGFTIDNLDTKNPEEAVDLFEEIFIHIRQEVEKNEALCMDNERERLLLVQAVSEKLYNVLKKKVAG